MYKLLFLDFFIVTFRQGVRDDFRDDFHDDFHDDFRDDFFPIELGPWPDSEILGGPGRDCSIVEQIFSK